MLIPLGKNYLTTFSLLKKKPCTGSRYLIIYCHLVFIYTEAAFLFRDTATTGSPGCGFAKSSFNTCEGVVADCRVIATTLGVSCLWHEVSRSRFLTRIQSPLECAPEERKTSYPDQCVHVHIFFQFLIKLRTTFKYA